MYLRNRQIGWGALTKPQALVVALLSATLIIPLGYFVWFPIFGITHKELQKFILVVGIVLQLGSGFEVVPTGKERALKFLGWYTGSSFSAGLCILPRLPFPFITLLFKLFFSEEVSKYLVGWVLEDDVTLNSIPVSVTVSGMTSDGVRVNILVALLYEVSQAATYLAQKESSDSNRLHEAVAYIAASRLRMAIKDHTVKELLQGDDGEANLASWIEVTCRFVKDFGLTLSRVDIIKVEIENKEVERAFDRVAAKEILSLASTQASAAFDSFKKGLPPGTSEEVAFQLFAAEYYDKWTPPVIVKVK